MENEPITTPQEAENRPVTAADIETQLTALAKRLTEQIEQAAEATAVRQQRMDAREQSLTRREWIAKARTLLTERGLPEDIAPCLAFEKEEDILPAIDAIEETFRSAVQQAVEERLSAAAPKTGAVVPLDQLSDEEYYAAVCRNN
ncbi:MAG: DUF4355 domain-containing protein [Clostridia bacterium]|nr:DUF4355 domain-containing protein [Clostridia bacterium]